MHVPAPRTDVCVCSTAQQPETRPFYEAYQQPMVDDNAEFEHLLHDEAMDDAEDAEDGGIDGDDDRAPRETVSTTLLMDEVREAARSKRVSHFYGLSSLSPLLIVGLAAVVVVPCAQHVPTLDPHDVSWVDRQRPSADDDDYDDLTRKVKIREVSTASRRGRQATSAAAMDVDVRLSLPVSPASRPIRRCSPVVYRPAAPRGARASATWRASRCGRRTRASRGRRGAPRPGPVGPSLGSGASPRARGVLVPVPVPVPERAAQGAGWLVGAGRMGAGARGGGRCARRRAGCRWSRIGGGGSVGDVARGCCPCRRHRRHRRAGDYVGVRCFLSFVVSRDLRFGKPSHFYPSAHSSVLRFLSLPVYIPYTAPSQTLRPPDYILFVLRYLRALSLCTPLIHTLLSSRTQYAPDRVYAFHSNVSSTHTCPSREHGVLHLFLRQMN